MPTTAENIKELAESLRGCLWIMAYYHKAAVKEKAGHRDVCNNPDKCGHCQAVLRARAILDALGL